MHFTQDQKASKTPTTIQLFRKLAKLRRLPSFSNYNLTLSNVADDNILAYVRTAFGWPQYLVVINVGQTSKPVDCSGGLRSSQGKVVALTPNMGTGLMDKTIDLKQVVVKRGQGMVILVG